MHLNLICPIRKVAVSQLPEERVRVQLLCDLIQKLDYPVGTIAVEKELRQIPHLRSVTAKLPQRRADVVCFAKGIHPTEELYPLLLIECKSTKLTRKMINQVVGYNHYLQAHFIALVNHEEIRTGWFNQDTRSYQFFSYLPTYPQLISFLSKKNSLKYEHKH